MLSLKICIGLSNQTKHMTHTTAHGIGPSKLIPDGSRNPPQ